MMPFTYFGTITAVHAPDHKLNVSKYQYEYVVLVTADLYAQISVTCIRNDSFASPDDFTDAILKVGDKVFVSFPRGDRSLGIIFGGGRNTGRSQDPALGRYYAQRFNKIVTYIDKDGNHSVTSDSGPNMHVKTNKIVLDDSVGETITLDKDTKTLTVTGKELVVKFTGSANIIIEKDANVTINGNATLKVAQNADITVGAACKLKAASLTANISGAAKVTAQSLDANISGPAKVQASIITLNGEGSGITTENSHFGIVDFITGIPVIASPTVKSVP